MTDMFERELLLQVGDSYKKARKAIEVIDKLLIELQKAADESPDFAEDINTDNTEGISAGRAIELLRKMKNKLMEAVRENEKFLNDYRSVMFLSRSVSVSDPTARMSMSMSDADSTRICVDTVKALVEKTETIASDTYPAVISEELCEALNEYNASVNVLSESCEQFLVSVHNVSELSETYQTDTMNSPDQSRGWLCTNCGHENQGEFCTVCGKSRQSTFRPGYGAPCIDVSELSETYQTDTMNSPDQSRGWLCTICGHKNQGEFCTVCGRSRQSTFRPVDSAPCPNLSSPMLSSAQVQAGMPSKPPQTKRISKFKEWFSSHKKEKKQPLAIDSVKFSAISPETVTAGKYLPINIMMYEDEYRSEVEDVISSYNEPAKESKSGYHNVERNSAVKVVLSSKDIHIDDDTEEGVWNGKYLNFEFSVKVPYDIADEQILLTASVYINDLPATKLKLIIDCNQKPKQNITVLRKDIVSAFVSYASQDRHRVAAIVQGMEKARPDMKVFFDVDSLRSGQRWEDELEKEIDNCDTLFLCWSQHAKESEWVDKEWRYALKTKGDEAIEPVPIVTPDKCPPPPELQHKHFNDRRIYIIEATKI